MSEEKKELTYQQALEKLNQLVVEIEDPKMPVEKVIDKVKESVELVEFCRNSLRQTRQEIDDVLNVK